VQKFHWQNSDNFNFARYTAKFRTVDMTVCALKKFSCSTVSLYEGKIWGVHSSIAEDSGLLWCYAASKLPPFQRNHTFSKRQHSFLRWLGVTYLKTWLKFVSLHFNVCSPSGSLRTIAFNGVLNSLRHKTWPPSYYNYDHSLFQVPT
jgi:hypothetical protein